MTPSSMINMVERFTNQYGVHITWNEPVITFNSRNNPVSSNTGPIKTAKVLLLKEKFNPMKVFDTGIIGLGQDHTRYIMALPDVDLKKDMVVTDNHAIKWKLGFIDWFDVAGTPVCKQATLTEVN